MKLVSTDIHMSTETTISYLPKKFFNLQHFDEELVIPREKYVKSTKICLHFLRLKQD